MGMRTWGIGIMAWLAYTLPGITAENGALVTGGDGAVCTDVWTCPKEELREFTVSAWVRADSKTGTADRVLVERVVPIPASNPLGLPAGNRVNFRLGLNSRGAPYLSFSGSGYEDMVHSVSADSTPSWANGRWNHFAADCSLEDDHIALYLNGETVALVPSAVIPFNGWIDAGSHTLSYPGRLTIGAANLDPLGSSTNFTSAFSGSIDEVSVWKGPLSESQREAIMYTKPMGGEADLVAYWSFDGDTPVDAGSNALHGACFQCTNATESIKHPSEVSLGTSSNATISFRTVQDSRYQVQYSNDLAQTNWLALGSVTVGDGSDVAVTDDACAVAARYYRVVSF